VIYKNSSLRALQAGWDADKIEQFEKNCLVIKDGNAIAPSSEYQLISDGRLDLDKLDKLEQLHPQDFDNFATVELQLNLLLGLRQHYQLLGGLLLTLINCQQFEGWLKNTGSESSFPLPDSDITVEVKRRPVEDKYEDEVLFSGQCLLRIKSADTQAPMLACYQAHLDQIQWLATQRKGFLLIETLLLLEPGGLSKAELENAGLTAEWFYLRTLLVFPDYVTLFGQDTFKQSLEKLAEVYWPSHVANDVIPASFVILKSVIPAFVQWHNNLKYAAATTGQTTANTTGQMTLAQLLPAPLKRKQ
jgi:hypothetical protein